MSSTDDTEALLAQRGSIYGDPVPQYGRIAQVWSGMIGYEISAHTAALMMAALKLVRAVDAPGHTDSLDDAHGYVSIGQRIEKSWHELEPKEPEPPVNVAPISGKNFPVMAAPYDAVCKAAGRHLPTELHTRGECRVGHR